MVFVLLGAAALILPFIACGFIGAHQVEEGHVGVYWRAGRLLDTITESGFHTKLPVIDRVANVQITMQTDSVTEIPCGTSGGVMITFDRIEVVNRLPRAKVLQTMKDYGEHYDKMWIFDKIHHEINQFCSSHTVQEVFIDLFDTLDENLQKALQESCDKHDTGIQIIAVRVTKPRIPEAIRLNYEQLETGRQAQAQAQRRAEAEAKRRQIELAMEIAEREAAAKMSAINDEIHLNREKAFADAQHYAAMKDAEANSARLTPEFLQYTLLQAIANNTKIYFGDKLPTMLAGDFAAAATGAVQRVPAE